MNDIQRSKHYEELERSPGNIIKVVYTCQMYNIRKIIYQQYFHQQEHINIFKINKKLRDVCMKCNFEFIHH